MVRHGETAWNRESRFQGWLDIPMNAQGSAQSDLLAQRFAGYPFDAVLSSPLARARETGRKIFEAAKCSVFITDDGFCEICHGSWEGSLASDVREKYAELTEQWKKQPESVRMPGVGGERAADVQTRALAALKRTAFTFSGDVMLATHDAVIRAILCYYLDMPLSSYWKFQIPNCSVSFIEFTDGFPRLGLLGDTSHLHSGFDRFETQSM
ncbi:MAG: histidine phosphatase family protein [Pyramidobacter sp.]|nr:histidine phosphatase family protein [Pyramidobacter sp.]